MWAVGVPSTATAETVKSDPSSCLTESVSSTPRAESASMRSVACEMQTDRVEGVSNVACRGVRLSGDFVARNNKTHMPRLM